MGRTFHLSPQHVQQHPVGCTTAAVSFFHYAMQLVIGYSVADGAGLRAYAGMLDLLYIKWFDAKDRVYLELALGASQKSSIY